MTPLEFAAALMAYCYATDGSVTSWGRTRQHNAFVGGHVNSWHLVFMGADVVYDLPVPWARAKLLAGRFGLRVVREEDHDHLQPLK
jgi:hypothetical protein